MPTNSEVKETFSNLYGLKLDDLIYRYTNNSQFFNNSKNDLYFDFHEFIMKNCNLNKTFKNNK